MLKEAAIKKVEQWKFKDNRKREYEWLTKNETLNGEIPRAKLMGRVMGYSGQNAWTVLKEYKKLFK